MIDKYYQIFEEQLQQEIIEEALNESNDVLYYLPYQAVIEEDKTTTKLRIVLDASTKTLSELASLNDHGIFTVVMLFYKTYAGEFYACNSQK